MKSANGQFQNSNIFTFKAIYYNLQLILCIIEKPKKKRMPLIDQKFRQIEMMIAVWKVYLPSFPDTPLVPPSKLVYPFQSFDCL